MPRKRKVAILTGNGDVRLVQEKLPRAASNQILIKVNASLISPGTEIMNIRRRRAHPASSQPEIALGYSVAGEVLENETSANHLQPGMRVAGIGAGYAPHANFVRVPQNLVVPIPDNMPDTEAVYACLGATALQGVRRAQLQLGEFGAVAGLGIVGNLTAQLCQLSGVRIIGWEKMKSRIEIAQQCDISHLLHIEHQDPVKPTQTFTTPYGLEFAIIAFGGNADGALAQIKPCMSVSADGHFMGRIILLGGCQVTVSGGASFGNLDIRASSRTGPGYHDPAYEKGADYPAAFVPFTTLRNLQEIMDLIDKGKLKVAPMTTHVIPLDQIAEIAEIYLNAPETILGTVLKMSH